MKGLTAIQLSELREVTTQSVYKAKLPKDENGRYLLSNPEVRDWVLAPYIKQLVKQQAIESDVDEEMRTLEDEKTKAQTLHIKRQSRKLDLEHEKAKKNLIPSDLMAIFLGHIAAGIRTNFLPLGNRIARGDTKLRDRIEKQIKKAIQKTLDNAADQLRKDSEKIAEALETE